ncbi:MAG: hypothetical protein RR587_13595 [Solibacillus sp.]
MQPSPFERPTDKYDERLFSIDEQICEMLKKRKDISNNYSGFPPKEVIANWAEKYDLYEEYLSSLFGSVRLVDYFKPRVDPIGFRKHIPVLKSVEINDRFYSVMFIRQYENASVLRLNVDWDGTDELPMDIHSRRSVFELLLKGDYDCRADGRKGSIGTDAYKFIVSPPLPDDVSELELVFREYNDTFREKPTGLEVVLQLE